jgi:hypothetical protein
MGNSVYKDESLALTSTTYTSYSEDKLFDYNSKDPLSHALLIKTSDISDKDIYKWLDSLELEKEINEMDVLTCDDKFRVWNVNSRASELTDYFYRKLVEKRKYQKAYILFRVSSGLDEMKSLALITCFKVPTTIIGVLETKKRKFRPEQGTEEAQIYAMKYVELPPALIESYIEEELAK